MKKITKIQCAYLAGLLDGEGYLGLTKEKVSYKARVVISNCNLSLLENAQSIIGGYISKKPKQKDNWTQGYNLTIGHINTWLPLVMPFLVGKKKKAEILLTACDLLYKRKKLTNTAGQKHIRELDNLNKLLRQKEWTL